MYFTDGYRLTDLLHCKVRVVSSAYCNILDSTVPITIPFIFVTGKLCNQAFREMPKYDSPCSLI